VWLGKKSKPNKQLSSEQVYTTVRR
jgi:hypothetical protein